VPITRQLFDLQAGIVGPVFSRIWQTPDSHYSQRIKHLIEPAVTVQWLSRFDRFNDVVQSDATDLVFGGTTRVNYTLTNRLLAKRRLASGSVVREILSVQVGQSYYTDSRAASYDQQYQSSFSNVYGTYVPSPFSPVQVTVSTQPLDSVAGQFRAEYDARFRAMRTISASGTLNGSLVRINAGWTKREYVPGLPGFDDPQFADHFLNANTTLKDRDNHVGGTFSFNYDLHHGMFLQRRLVAYYNTQCCGVSVDYQTVDLSQLGLSIARDRRFGISFTLAGIGSFSNPMGSFGDNSGRR
jgi:hypothetical protein